MQQHGRVLLITAAALSTVVGCGLLGGAPLECRFPEGTTLAYAGRTTLGQLGLGAGDPDSGRAAMVYVTRDPIPYSGSLPVGAEPPPDQRAFCAIFDPGAGAISMHGSVPIDWSPPAP